MMLEQMPQDPNAPVQAPSGGGGSPAPLQPDGAPVGGKDGNFMRNVATGSNG